MGAHLAGDLWAGDVKKTGKPAHTHAFLIGFENHGLSFLLPGVRPTPAMRHRLGPVLLLGKAIMPIFDNVWDAAGATSAGFDFLDHPLIRSALTLLSLPKGESGLVVVTGKGTPYPLVTYSAIFTKS